jgi:hypothetical protein
VLALINILGPHITPYFSVSGNQRSEFVCSVGCVLVGGKAQSVRVARSEPQCHFPNGDTADRKALPLKASLRMSRFVVTSVTTLVPHHANA